MSNEKQVNRRTFKEVVITQLNQLADILELQIKSNLSRADFYRHIGEREKAKHFTALADGGIDARHEALIMKIKIEQGGDL